MSPICLRLMMTIVVCLCAVMTPIHLAAADKQITIWWAQWDPADGLHKMGRAFTKETGIAVKVHQIPWGSFQNDVFLNFGKDKTDFDIVIGDSQWLGKAATSGWYLELTDWIKKKVDLGKTHPKALRYLCEYPAGSGKIFAAPCETDAIGVAYRKDWFEDPKEQEAFKARFNRNLAVPRTWSELRDIAVFFQRPEQKRYGLVMLTGRSYDALTMGFEQILYAHGGAWGNPDTFQVRGQLNSSGAVAAAEFMQELCKSGPPNATNSDYGQTLASFTNGSTAMMVNYFAFFPTIVNEMGEKSGFFAVPQHKGKRVITLGGQGMSISAKTSPEQQELAKQFIAWFSQNKMQQRWVTLPACFTADVELLASDTFKQATPYNAAFAESLDHLQDFWNVPEYGELLAECQTWLGKILDGDVSAKAGLESLTEAHEKIFKRTGRLK